MRDSVKALVDAGHKALGICCDVAAEAQVKAMVKKTISTFGRLDVAFNCPSLEPI